MPLRSRMFRRRRKIHDIMSHGVRTRQAAIPTKNEKGRVLLSSASIALSAQVGRETYLTWFLQHISMYVCLGWGVWCTTCRPVPRVHLCFGLCRPETYSIGTGCGVARGEVLSHGYGKTNTNRSPHGRMINIE